MFVKSDKSHMVQKRRSHARTRCLPVRVLVCYSAREAERLCKHMCVGIRRLFGHIAVRCSDFVSPPLKFAHSGAGVLLNVCELAGGEDVNHMPGHHARFISNHRRRPLPSFVAVVVTGRTMMNGVGDVCVCVCRNAPKKRIWSKLSCANTHINTRV